MPLGDYYKVSFEIVTNEGAPFQMPRQTEVDIYSGVGGGEEGVEEFLGVLCAVLQLKHYYYYYYYP